MSTEIDEHREYLSDAHRIDAFRRALREAVRSGDVVVDLGAGTGILGLLACEAGAARVYAIDAGPILEIARQLAMANGYADRIVHLRETSTRVTLPEAVDVIVTDQIGQFGMEAGLVEFLRDARRRWLKPGGRTVPASVDLVVAPVETALLRDHVEFWKTRPAGIDASAVARAACNSGYPHTVEPEWLLGPAASVVSLDPAPSGPDVFRGRVELSIERRGDLDGLAGWFTARLSPSVTMTNAPGDPCRINRRQVFLPIATRTPVWPGDRLTISIVTRPADMLVNWTVTVEAAGGARPAVTFRHSTLDGMLMGADDIRRSRPDFTPRLTPAGEARRSVLELCDGTRAIRDIEQAMLARHPALLPDAAAAAAFVAEVLSVYAR